MRTKKKTLFALSLIFGVLVCVCLSFHQGALYKYFGRETSVWPNEFQIVDIKSSLDGEFQKAYFYNPKGSVKVPLLISLHSWSGDYTQQDALSKIAKEKGWVYVHPDFRGPNNNPKSGISQFVINDIDDAIDFAIEHANVDMTHIYVSGGSGGGLAALTMYMKSKHEINIVNAWVPITDLVKWYEESNIKKNNYANDILAMTNSIDGTLNIEEAKKRSPLYMETPLKKVKQTKLFILAGINDGWEDGLVPITHSLYFYNKILNDLNVNEKKYYFSSEEITKIAMDRVIKKSNNLGKIAGRSVLYEKEFFNIKVKVFDGGHETLSVFIEN